MFAWIATRTGVQLPSPPAFAWSAAQSEGCHAGAQRRRAVCSNFYISAPRLRLGRPAFFVHDPPSKAQPMDAFYYVYILVSEVNDEIHYIWITTSIIVELTNKCGPILSVRRLPIVTPRRTKHVISE